MHLDTRKLTKFGGGNVYEHMDDEETVESWRLHYNGERHHSALGNLAPWEFAASGSQVGMAG